MVLEGEVEGVRGCLLVEDRECGVEEGVVVRSVMRSEMLDCTSVSLLTTLSTHSFTTLRTILVHTLRTPSLTTTLTHTLRVHHDKVLHEASHAGSPLNRGPLHALHVAQQRLHHLAHLRQHTPVQQGELRSSNETTTTRKSRGRCDRSDSSCSISARSTGSSAVRRKWSDTPSFTRCDVASMIRSFTQMPTNHSDTSWSNRDWMSLSAGDSTCTRRYTSQPALTPTQYAIISRKRWSSRTRFASCPGSHCNRSSHTVRMAPNRSVAVSTAAHSRKKHAV